jgi:hypothetical protein
VAADVPAVIHVRVDPDQLFVGNDAPAVAAGTERA